MPQATNRFSEWLSEKRLPPGLRFLFGEIERGRKVSLFIDLDFVSAAKHSFETGDGFLFHRRLCCAVAI